MTAFEYLAPRTISEVIALLTEKGEKARILAGGTDIIVQVREGRRAPDWLVDIKHVPEVNELTYDPARGLTLGAAVPCYRIYEHPDRYGVWGHDLADLWIEGLAYYPKHRLIWATIGS